MNEENFAWLMIGILIGWFGCIWFGRVVENSLKELAEKIGDDFQEKMKALKQFDLDVADCKECGDAEGLCDLHCRD